MTGTELKNTLIDYTEWQDKKYSQNIINRIVHLTHFKHYSWIDPGILVLNNGKHKVHLINQIKNGLTDYKYTKPVDFYHTISMNLTEEDAVAATQALNELIYTRTTDRDKARWACKYMDEVFLTLKRRPKMHDYTYRNVRNTFNEILRKYPIDPTCPNHPVHFIHKFMNKLYDYHVILSLNEEKAAPIAVSDLISDLSKGKKYVINATEWQYRMIVLMLCYYMLHRSDLNSGKRPIFIYIDNLKPFNQSKIFSDFLLSECPNVSLSARLSAYDDADYWQMYFQSYVQG